MYEKYKKAKNPDNSFIQEIKKKDIDVEDYVRSSLERPIPDYDTKAFDCSSTNLTGSAARRGRNERKSSKANLPKSNVPKPKLASKDKIPLAVREETKQTHKDQISFYEQMVIEHNKSKDSASPSSVEQPEVISAVDTHKMRDKMNNYVMTTYWEKDLRAEEEPEMQNPPIISAANHEMCLSKNNEEANVSSEIFDYSKDSGLFESKTGNDVSINSSSIDLELLNRYDTFRQNQENSENSFLDKSLLIKEAPSTDRNETKIFETGTSIHSGKYDTEQVKFGINNIDDYLDNIDLE